MRPAVHTSFKLEEQDEGMLRRKPMEGLRSFVSFFVKATLPIGVTFCLFIFCRGVEENILMNYTTPYQHEEISNK